jgi:hypothetical protein
MWELERGSLSWWRVPAFFILRVLFEGVNDGSNQKDTSETSWEIKARKRTISICFEVFDLWFICNSPGEGRGNGSGDFIEGGIGGVEADVGRWGINRVIEIGKAPFLECSTRGDKRFSAFCAKIKGRNNKSVEEIYQAAKIFEDGSTGLSWKKAKGRKPINIKEVAILYSQLWDEYINENPHLLEVLKQTSGLSDMFGQKNKQCQAIELWRIRKNRMGGWLGENL